MLQKFPRESLTRIAGDLVAQFGYDARLIGTVAQLVEQGPFKALVLGSSPSRPTIYIDKSILWIIFLESL